MSVLLLGFGLGLRHAVDADHVAAIATLLQREPGALRAARLAVVWGLGHTLSFLAIAFLIALLGVSIPARLELGAQLLVAAMLITLGVMNVVGESAARTAGRSDSRPFVIGVVHGLAGSAGITLLTISTLPSRGLACGYLALFGFGTVIGMVLVTMAMAHPIRWTVRDDDQRSRIFAVAAGLVSVILGLLIAFDVLSGLAN